MQRPAFVNAFLIESVGVSFRIPFRRVSAVFSFVFTFTTETLFVINKEISSCIIEGLGSQHVPALKSIQPVLYWHSKIFLIFRCLF